MTRTVAATIAVFVSSFVQTDRDVRVLAAGQTVERSLDSGERHTYQLTLNAGEFVSIIVEQRGIDVAVRSVDPGDVTLAKFQDDYRKTGEEHPAIVAATTGTYSLIVTPEFSGQGAGEDTIRIAEVRQATAEDRSLQEVATLRTDAWSLTESGKYDDAAARLRRALEIVEGVKGPEDFVAARVVWALATCLLDQRKLALAEPLFQRALKTLSNASAEQTIRPPCSRSRDWGTLVPGDGTACQSGTRAAAVSRQPREVARAQSSDRRLWTLMVLGLVRHAAADIQQAEAYDRRAMAILEASSRTRHPHLRGSREQSGNSGPSIRGTTPKPNHCCSARCSLANGCMVWTVDGRPRA